MQERYKRKGDKAMFRNVIRKTFGVLTLLCLMSVAGCKEKPAGSEVQSGDAQKETLSQVQNQETSEQKNGEISVGTQAPELTEQISAVKESEKGENTERSATVVLSDTGITVDGTGCAADGTGLKITEAGVYEISGTLTNGSICVNADKESEVHLILNGVTVHNENGAALYCKKASKVTVTLAADSVNAFSDGEAYVLEEGETEPDAALFSKQDLVINGEGKLTVTSVYGDAIKGKDSLYILGGEIYVNAADDGIIGRDLLYVSGGSVMVDATADGLKSTNDADAALGNIVIDGGTFRITAGQDGMQAENSITVNDGAFMIVTGGGSANASVKSEEQFRGFGRGWDDWGNREVTEESEETASSAKGLKAGVLLTVKGGTLELDTSDDALHGNKNVLLAGGEFKISTGDDGVHADGILQIEGNSKLDITKCYEGLEALEIVISGGEINVVASDDGLNAAGGTDGSGLGRPGVGMFGEGEGEVTINGGTVILHASGDGLDSNGNLTINGGAVYVYGPTSGGNGVLDYAGTFCVNGGSLLGIGTSDMAQTPTDMSGQYSVAATLSARGKEGDRVEVKINGETVFSVEAPIPFAYILASSGDFAKDAQVSITVAGTESYSGTLTEVVTCFGMSGGMGGFGGFGGNGDFGGNGSFGGGGRPNKGEFGNRGDFESGENGGMRPELPEGGFFELPEGELPEFPEGGFPN